MNFERLNRELADIWSFLKFTFWVNPYSVFFAPFCRPAGLAILPNLLCCKGLEVPEHVCAPCASHLGQTRQLQNLGSS
ncbi:hypothetical protein [Dissulfuribacter thermophilus]|uniref:hypothetical protein n=1 Tax=Dissulfuribacter thermophilus TaxID=1156395 RepID=UPI0011472DB9|nr:hypothetical protein [Dissulfuribacter thermophilus]